MQFCFNTRHQNPKLTAVRDGIIISIIINVTFFFLQWESFLIFYFKFKKSSWFNLAQAELTIQILVFLL